jgi:predicted TIM-barrel fold metal-dependent hydrolase
VDDYRRVQRRLGLQRVIVVTPSNYGTDNRCTLDAVAEFGPRQARGIAVIDETISADALERLEAGHVRGIRFNTTRPGGVPVSQIESLARRVAPLGWHVQLHVPPALLIEHTRMLSRLPTDIVLDHVARLPGAGGLNQPAALAMLDLLEIGRTWVKLSGLYQDSQAGPPSYADRARIAAELLRRYPERMVWGSDWPHTPALRGDVPMPQDETLLDILVQSTNEANLQRVLVTNPSMLYGFSPWS